MRNKGEGGEKVKLVSKLGNVAVIRTFELMAIAMMMIIKFHIYHVDREDEDQTAKETSVSPSNRQILFHLKIVKNPKKHTAVSEPELDIKII